MDIRPKHHDQAQIAYLSACSTAEIKVRNLADESIHLANAFQLAGFTNVIGTLWAADDNAAVEIASKFYEGLDLYDEEGTASTSKLEQFEEATRGINFTLTPDIVEEYMDRLDEIGPTPSIESGEVIEYALSFCYS
ncbi:hypothetical protein MMC30_008291 [Trapelia coarctata]|nr:hypothetical protein [Trapelia coarctata]